MIYDNIIELTRKDGLLGVGLEEGSCEKLLGEVGDS